MIKISMIVPTYKRPNLLAELFENIDNQILKPFEIIVVDGTSPNDLSTEKVVMEKKSSSTFDIQYLRHSKGTAIQRNAGIEIATGDFLAFIDDDIRLDSFFFENIIKAIEVNNNLIYFINISHVKITLNN